MTTATEANGATLTGRLLFLQEFAVGLKDQDRDAILRQAKRGVGWLFGGGEVHVLEPDALPSGLATTRGQTNLEGVGEVYLAYVAGPPTPCYLVLQGIDLDDAQERRLAMLFFEHLLAALEVASYRFEAERQARTDWLTGLANRRAFERVLAQPLAPKQVLGVIALDLAGGMGAPPTYAANDLQLRHFGRAITTSLAAESQAFRISDHEFTVVAAEQEAAHIERSLQQQGFVFSVGWARREEAHALGLVELAYERMRALRSVRGQEAVGPPPFEVLRQSSSEQVPGAQPPTQPNQETQGSAIQVHCGAAYLKGALELLLAGHRFEVPVHLVVDAPLGYALTPLPPNRHPVLVVTESRAEGYLHDLLALEPEGLIAGGSSESGLVAGLKRVARGERFYEGPMVKDYGLSERERAVWRFVVQGLGNAQIAEALGIDERTVTNYVSNLRKKLRLDNRSELVVHYLGKRPGNDA